MVTGLDVFIAHFQEYTGHYVLIGGGAVDWHMNQSLPFRATKDLDIILVVEALTNPDEKIKLKMFHSHHQRQ